MNRRAKAHKLWLIMQLLAAGNLYLNIPEQNIWKILF